MHVVFDLDGTICFDGQTIAPAICEALQLLEENGFTLHFASARPIRDLLPVLPAAFHHCSMVGGNGAYTYQNGTVEVTALPPASVQTVREWIEREALTYLADGPWDFSYNGDGSHTIFKNLHKTNAQNIALDELIPICKLLLFHPSQTLLEALRAMPVTLHQYKQDDAVDIACSGLSKVTGLRQLGVTDFIAFGNDVNDVSMFQAARYAVCVGRHVVGQFADEVVHEAEVAARIRQLALSPVKNASL